jgi:hypothetical protein
MSKAKFWIASKNHTANRVQGQAATATAVELRPVEGEAGPFADGDRIRIHVTDPTSVEAMQIGAEYTVTLTKA